ncbi:MAG: hypothetical protein IJ693_05570 [Bacteroidaceae bacterium]|nr:hypothetical protein [Bacteroidaceae bacterium]
MLALLYVPYTLLLHRESFFRLNRFTLLAILLLSLLLPLCNFHFLAEDGQPVTQMVHRQAEAVGTPIAHKMKGTTPVPPVVREKANPATAQSALWSWHHILSLLCVVGMLAALLFRIGQFVHMGMLMRRGCVWKDKIDGFTIYCHAGEVTPCSWMHNIIISHKDYCDHRNEILLHEQGHILHHHSVDILLLTLVQLVQWWNPLVYMLGNSMRDVHEYEADHYVLQQGISLSQYQNLLIRKAIGISTFTFANNFNHSLVKQRIQMMHKEGSQPWMRMKVLYILPLAIIALSAFATPRVMSPVEDGISTLEYRFINMKAIQSLYQ